ncbi:hypothetical protein NF212_10045 [Parasalinivibrio latis]|uniref:ribonuclease T2 family protein n=1 Tax=Parasalinivibrio latis TaxID=2952610 RepID=UPI0030E3E767
MRVLLIGAGLLLLSGCSTFSNPSCCTLDTHLLVSQYDNIQANDKYPETNTTATDYFALVYSWAPGFCAYKRSKGPLPDRLKLQCDSSNTYGWVVHGLWAQSASAKKVEDQPRYCQGDLPQLPTYVVDAYLCMSPGRSLLQGEWEKHGSCDFENAEDYFAQTEELHSALTLPGNISDVHAAQEWMKRHNPSLKTLALGKIGHELAVCYDTDFNLMSCPDALRD